jgi:hypothetical protein
MFITPTDQVASFSGRAFNNSFCRNLLLDRCYAAWQHFAPKVTVQLATGGSEKVLSSSRLALHSNEYDQRINDAL